MNNETDIVEAIKGHITVRYSHSDDSVGKLWGRYHEPASLSQTAPPLYLRVACWALQQARAVTRHEVAEAFGITSRCAGNIIGDILRRQDERIESEMRSVVGRRGQRQLALRVYAMPGGQAQSEVPMKAGRRKTDKIVKRIKDVQHHELVQWFLRKPLFIESQEWQDWRTQCPCDLVHAPEADEQITGF